MALLNTLSLLVAVQAQCITVISYPHLLLGVLGQPQDLQEQRLELTMLSIIVLLQVMETTQQVQQEA